MLAACFLLACASPQAMPEAEERTAGGGSTVESIIEDEVPDTWGHLRQDTWVRQSMGPCECWCPEEP